MSTKLPWDIRIVFRSINIAVFVFAAFLLTIIWLGLHYKINEEKKAELAAAIKETSNFARVFEEHTLRTIRGADQTVLYLKYEYEREGRALDIPQQVAEGRFSSQPFVLLGVIDENGDLAASSQVPFVPSNLKDREHFVVHKDRDSQKLFISKPVLGRSSGKWSIQMTRRVDKPDGLFGGVVVVSVDPFYFTEFYKEMDLGKNSSVTLVGLDGTVRARMAGNNAEIGQDISKNGLLERISQEDRGSYKSRGIIDGVERIYSYRRLNDYPLAVLVGVDEKEYFAVLDGRIRGYYVAAGLITIAIVMFAAGMLYAIRRQEAAETELKSALDGLEAKVESRTSELQQKNTELEVAYTDLKAAQSQVIHQEKMASIGQLAAGIAHEINNPLGFSMSNFATLKKYVMRINEVYRALHSLKEICPEGDADVQKQKKEEIEALEKRNKIDYIMRDMETIFAETQDGLQRVEDIVKALRIFSRIDHQGKREQYDLNEGIRNTLIVSRNEIKYIASVETHFSNVSLVEAVGGQINQVLLNLILNAAYAIKEKIGTGEGKLIIRTFSEGAFVCCSIQDNGGGIPEAIEKNVFNPFFTTKPVGQGTGLGLSISYDIVVNKHGGDISFTSVEGEGTTFFVRLPKTAQD